MVGGNWSYDYNTPISSIAFTNDTNLQTIDFSLSDGLASLTSLDNTFKGCTMLTAVDFTNCDLTNVTSAADCFAACSALFYVTIPANSWKPDVDFSDCALIAYAELQDIINSLYTYATGTHTITFNQTYWDSLTQAQQQTISDSAQLKGWTTNAVMVVYSIKGKSTAASETFTLEFIDDNTQAITTETITCAVDGSGNWEHQYNGEKIYSLANTFFNNSTITEIEHTENLAECVSLRNAYNNMANLQSITFASGSTFSKVQDTYGAFATLPSLTAINNIANATFENVTNADSMFYASSIATISLPSATFERVQTINNFAYRSTGVITISLPSATFNSVATAVRAFSTCARLATLNLQSATFANATSINEFLINATALTSLDLSSATFAKITSARQAFNVISSLVTLDLPMATFELLSDGYVMFSQYNTAALTTINMPNATFENLSASASARNLFNANLTRSLRNLSVAANKLKVTMDLSGPNLTYQSILNVANWCADLTGQTAQTIKFYSVAWNALSSAEQATIQGILQGKNWNLATA